MKQSSNDILYLDETWINQNYTVSKCWQDTTSSGGSEVKPPLGKGSQLIILHAGTKDGFLENAELIFQAKNDEDYHHQMNAACFEKWFRTQLIPNIIRKKADNIMEESSDTRLAHEKRSGTSRTFNQATIAGSSQKS